MRREQKKQVQDFVELLSQAHQEIRKEMQSRNPQEAMDLLAQCQEGAIQLGGLIEAAEGEGAPTIPLLESYCELAYQIYEELEQWSGLSADAECADRAEGTMNGAKAYKKLRNALLRIESSVRHDIKMRPEIVFFPYKASMWDSLESVWRAAEADPDCDAYVVPIPYYDRNGDGTLGEYHYEGNDFPPDVPVTYYETYSLEERKPDIAYIHNPYDQGNVVTTVDTRFYSKELKKYVNKLVYIPYYTTTGGMAEAQMRCYGYYPADYIVIQAQKYRKFFAPELPDGKFLPFGSPKFDRVIRMCANPGPVPEAWKERISGKKVYFYNTSINGLLAETPIFLKKMAYVFRCFQGREDVCLIWRPHPLLESTIDSIRPQYGSAYKGLKRLFLENGIGIYDDTPDITETISHCDVYLGDMATSVTSLFGMAGKPLFIFNNRLDCAPGKEDWRGEIIRGFQPDGQDEWMITQGDKLYHSPENDYRFNYVCDLSEYSGGGYYIRALEMNGKLYVCPGNAQDILVVENGRVQRRIPLERHLEQYGAFVMAWKTGRYLFLIPMRYPAIVKYDTEQDRVEYIQGYNDIFVNHDAGIWRVGGSCIWEDFLLLASPVDDRILAVNVETGKTGLIKTGAGNSCGCMCMVFDGTDMWLLPYMGTVVTRWNPKSGETREYGTLPAGFQCRELPCGPLRTEQPFSQAAFSGKYVYLSPQWANMCVRLDKETGETIEWKPSFPVLEKEQNGYFVYGARGLFLPRADRDRDSHGEKSGEWEQNREPEQKRERKQNREREQNREPEQNRERKQNGEWECNWRYFSCFDRKLYDIDLESGAYREISICFQMEELQAHVAGFWEGSDWMQYACEENAFHSLENLLDGNLSGNAFDRERQLRAYEKIAANNDGTCGEKVHRFVRDKLEE